MVSKGCKCISIALLIALSGCATSAQPKHMVPQSLSILAGGPASPFYSAIAIRKVGGGDETNPLMYSKVGDNELREALRLSLSQYGFLSISDTNVLFGLDVFLVELKQPTRALTLIVDSYIRYTLSRVRDGKVIFDDIIPASFKATLEDAFVGYSRLKLATEGSVRTNIAAFLGRLGSLDVEE